MTEDLQLRMLSGPPKYTSRTDGPVEHITLRTTGGEVMGYIYVNDDDDAAGWVPHPAASPAAQNLASFWVGILLESKKRGCKPSEALAAILETTHSHSHVVPGSRETSPGLAALKSRAG